MTSNECVVAVVDALNAARLPYMLVGSYSSNYYGVARATRDADFVVQARPQDVIAAFGSLKDTVSLEPQASFETVTGTFRHVGRVVGGPFKVELFYLSDDPHDRERFARRRVVESLGRQIYIPSPEDVIITKLRWAALANRSKDLSDATKVIQTQQALLDWGYVESWCERHGSHQLLDQLRREMSSG
ncbi:MAG: hypothetical protein U1D55_05990 [Phycisphaerae bacterium]